MLFGLRLKRPRRLPAAEQLSVANEPLSAGGNGVRRVCCAAAAGAASRLGGPAARRGAGPPAPHLFLYQSNGPGNIPEREGWAGGEVRGGAAKRKKKKRNKI